MGREEFLAECLTTVDALCARWFPADQAAPRDVPQVVLVAPRARPLLALLATALAAAALALLLLQALRPACKT